MSITSEKHRIKSVKVSILAWREGKKYIPTYTKSCPFPSKISVGTFLKWKDKNNKKFKI